MGKNNILRHSDFSGLILYFLFQLPLLQLCLDKIKKNVGKKAQSEGKNAVVKKRFFEN
jgi:hypothetical protein